MGEERGSERERARERERERARARKSQRVSESEHAASTLARALIHSLCVRVRAWAAVQARMGSTA